MGIVKCERVGVFFKGDLILLFNLKEKKGREILVGEMINLCKDTPKIESNATITPLLLHLQMPIYPCKVLCISFF